MPSTFQALDTSFLIDLLATQTFAYTKYLKEGGDSQEFELCKIWIQLLQKEINFRRETDPSISITDVNIKFEDIDESTTGRL